MKLEKVYSCLELENRNGSLLLYSAFIFVAYRKIGIWIVAYLVTLIVAYLLTLIGSHLDDPVAVFFSSLVGQVGDET